MDSLADQIRGQIERCVSGKFSLDDFRTWFVPLARNIEQSADSEAIKFAYKIEGILGEASSGHWTEFELLEELAHIVNPGEWHISAVAEPASIQWTGPNAPQELRKSNFGANDYGFPLQSQRVGSNALSDSIPAAA